MRFRVESPKVAAEHECTYRRGRVSLNTCSAAVITGVRLPRALTSLNRHRRALGHLPEGARGPAHTGHGH